MDWSDLEKSLTAFNAFFKREHQPHPGPSRSAHQVRYDAGKQAQSEAHLKTPKGEAERQARNQSMTDRQSKSKIGKATTGLHGGRGSTSGYETGVNIPSLYGHGQSVRGYHARDRGDVDHKEMARQQSRIVREEIKQIKPKLP